MAYRLGGGRSIQLSYEGMGGATRAPQDRPPVVQGYRGGPQGVGPDGPQVWAPRQHPVAGWEQAPGRLVPGEARYVPGGRHM